MPICMLSKVGSPFHHGLPYGSAATVARIQLFQMVRSDQPFRSTANLLHRRLRVRIFAPHIGYSYQVISASRMV